MTKEQQGLLDMAKDSIRAAELLASQDLNRFAVSRSYYAMFYCAEALLLEKGLSFSKHSGVIAAFGKEFVKPGDIPSEFHEFLIEASEVREEGDYDFAAVIEDSECAEQLARANKFFEMTQEYLQNPSRTSS